MLLLIVPFPDSYSLQPFTAYTTRLRMSLDPDSLLPQDALDSSRRRSTPGNTDHVTPWHQTRVKRDHIPINLDDVDPELLSPWSPFVTFKTLPTVQPAPQLYLQAYNATVVQLVVVPGRLLSAAFVSTKVMALNAHNETVANLDWPFTESLPLLLPAKALLDHGATSIRARVCNTQGCGELSESIVLQLFVDPAATGGTNSDAGRVSLAIGLSIGLLAFCVIVAVAFYVRRSNRAIHTVVVFPEPDKWELPRAEVGVKKGGWGDTVG